MIYQSLRFLLRRRQVLAGARFTSPFTIHSSEPSISASIAPRSIGSIAPRSIIQNVCDGKLNHQTRGLTSTGHQKGKKKGVRNGNKKKGVRNGTKMVFNMSKSSRRKKTKQYIIWKRPPKNFLKYNVDGTCKFGIAGNIFATGAVLRNSWGTLLCKFSYRLSDQEVIGAANSSGVEFVALKMAVLQAIEDNHNLDRVIFESDSKDVVKTMKRASKGQAIRRSPFIQSIVAEIMRLKPQGMQELRIQHVLREGNIYADYMADEGLTINRAGHKEIPPPKVRKEDICETLIFRNNLKGVPIERGKADWAKKYRKKSNR